MSISQDVAKTQYNGIILLTSYLYRLFVQQSFANRLGDSDNEALAKQYNTMLDEMLIMTYSFEQKQELTNSQHERFLELYTEVQTAFQSFFGQAPLSFSQKAAIVTASFYGERFMNAKIILLSQLFNTQISNDYDKRLKFYDDRIKLMDYISLALSKGNELDIEVTAQVEAWYNNVSEIQAHIVSDLGKVPQLLIKQ